MAKIRDYAVTVFSATTANMVCEMPEHQAGDLILAFVNKDTAAAFTTPSTASGTPVSSGNWTALQSSLSAGAAGGVYGFRATSSNENVTFALGAETCCALLVSIKNVNGTTTADAISASSATGADDTTIPFSSGSVTTAHTNCLVFVALSTDSGIAPSAEPGWTNLFAGDTGANSLGVAYTFEKDTSTVVTGPNFYAGVADDTRAFMVAVRDDGNNSEIDAHIARGTTPAVLLSPFTGSSTAAVDLGAWIAANARIFANISGKAVSGVAISSVADSGYNPFRAAATTPGASSTTGLSHTEFTFAAAKDLTLQKGILFGTFRPTTPRDYVDVGTAARGGIYFVIGSAAATLKAWILGGQFSQTTKPAGRQNWAIQVGQTANTTYDVQGSLNLTSVPRVAIGSSGYYGAPSIQWSELYLLNEVVLAGGTPTFPFRFDEFVMTVNNGCGLIPLIEVNGSAATLWTPIRFGGTESCHVLMNLRTLQYPKKSDEVDYLDWHVDDGYVGIEFYGLSGDTFSFRNCTFTSESPYYWRFNASHSSGATIDFEGSVVVNALVSLQPTVNLSDVIFNSCAEIDSTGETLTQCTFTNSNALSTEGAYTITGSTQNLLQSRLNNLIDCNFTNNTISNSAIKLVYTGTPQNISLSMTTGSFSGNSKDIAWWAPESSNLVINVSGTANPTTSVANNTNTVVLQSTKTFNITNIAANTEIRIYRQSDMAVLAGIEDISSATPETVNMSISNDVENTGRYKATYAYNYTGDIPIYVVAHNLSFLWLRSSSTLKATDSEFKISQIADRQYQNP